MKRKALLTVPFAILVGLGFADMVDAHNATASGTCQGGVQWSATNYDKTVTNSITVTIDGTVRHHDPDMKSSDAGTIATDKTVGHAWSVVINAPGTQYDRNLSGSYPACVTVAPTTTVASSTTVGTTTTTASTDTSPLPTVVTDPTTTVVAVDVPPVPSSVALAPPVTIVAGVAEEPALPRTGLDGTIVGLAVLFVIVGTVLVVRGRRVQ